MAISSEHDVLSARWKGHGFARDIGFSSADATLIATLISELARNVLVSVQLGEIVLTPVDDEDKTGVLISARYKAAAWHLSALSDLSGLESVVDECAVVYEPDKGALVTFKKWRR